MEKYSCKNCMNLKTRLIKKKHILGITREGIKEALKYHNIEKLDLVFPFNFIIYKRILRFGECQIIYCSDDMLKRNVYTYKDDLEKITPEMKPCPKYK